MTKAEKILNGVIDTYCGGVYSISRMSAVDYSMALEAVNQALQQSDVIKSLPINKCNCERCTGIKVDGYYKDETE